MAPSRRIQSLFFVVREEELDSGTKAPSIKAFALLPHKLKIGPKVREALLKNQIRILRNGDDPSAQFWQESDHVEMIEVLFDEVDIMAEVSDESKLFLSYDTCNEEIVQRLFGSDFCFKTKLNADSVLSVLDGSKDTLNVLERLMTFKADISFANSNGDTLLHFALKKGHFDLFELLLKCGVSVSAANNDGVTPLHLAASKGYLKFACLLLQRGAPLNVKTTSNLLKDSTPLHFAVKGEHSYLVKFLLRRGANVDAEDYNGTVLLQAVKTQDLDMVKTVLTYRPAVGEPSNRRALYEAVFGSSEQIVRLLLSFGIKAVVEERGAQELMCCAIAKGYLQIVEQLVDGGIALNYGYKIPPLHLAAQYGSKGIVRLLLRVGANVNLEGSDKQTPLIYAIEAGQYILDPAAADVAKLIVEILVENGARVKAKDSKGRTAEKLLKLGAKANIDVVDFQGRTALHKAAARGNTKAIEELIQRGANVNARCKEGKTPLIYAAEEGWFDSHTWVTASRPPSPPSVDHFGARSSNLFAVLVSKGANVNARCNKGRTPLLHAVGKRRFMDIRDLLDLGADIDAKDHAGKTPLHVASESGFVVFIEALIHNGADVDARCAKGKTPLIYAAGKDHFDAVILLLLHDARIDIVSCSGRTALDEAYDGFVPKLLETLFCYCFTDRRFLVASVARPLVVARRPRFDHPVPSLLQEFDVVYERHVVRTTVIIPSAHCVHTPPFKTDAIYDFKVNATAERELMKTLPVGDTGISFYDVLMYSSNQLAYATKDDSFVKAMEQLDYKEKIPIFADVIQLKFQQAYRRKKLMDCRSNIFKLLCPGFSGLLDELQERIVSFLSNSDLTRLQIACTRILASLNAHKNRENEKDLTWLQIARTRILALLNPDENRVNEKEPYLLLCCSNYSPQALRNEVDPLISSLRDAHEPNAEPYWSVLTRMRL